MLIDAVVPKVWFESEVNKNLQLMRSQYEEIRAQAPESAKVAIPWAEAMPAMARRVNTAKVSAAMPIIDIVAENGQNSPESTKVWREAHKELTANNPNREYVFASGSSHKVMSDQPDLVVNAILRMLQKVPRSKLVASARRPRRWLDSISRVFVDGCEPRLRIGA